MTKEQKVCLGAVVGVHGIKGEVKVKSFASLDRNIDKYSAIEDQNGRKLEIKVVGHSKELVRVKIKGVDDRNLAMAMVGVQFWVNRETLPELKEEDEFYQIDLIGLKVFEQSLKQKVGEVAGFYNFGAGDILEIKLDENEALEMIPFNHQYVPEVNIKEGYIIVSSVSMLFDQDDGE